MNFTDLQIPFDEAENYFKPNNKEKLNRLFYKDRNYNKLLNDTTYFLIGEKGSGKTTYCAYFSYESFNRFLIISLDVLICRYSPLFRAFPALFISEEPHKSFYYPSCFHSQK